jgi:predicted TIM-barrel fold metal-dependent hydrolase
MSTLRRIVSMPAMGSLTTGTAVPAGVWGSDWPHLPDGQRDTGEVLNLLADWAPDAADRRIILVDGPDRLFFR